MKKTIISVIILFFAVFTAFGQSITLEPTASNQVSISAYGSQAPILNGYRTGGTASSPTAVTNGSSLLRLYGEGYSGVGHTPRFNAGITLNAAQNFTPTANGTSILFWTTANGTTTAFPKMIIGENGNLGIGISPTESPNGNLSFGNTNNNRKILLYEDANNENQFMGFGVNAQTLRYQIPSTTNSHVFYTGTSSTNSTELMRITGTGNVGIGTATPQTNLEVKTASGKYGVQHTDGTVNLSTYVSSQSGGYLGTRSNHPLSFYVNDSDSKLSIETTGNVKVNEFTQLGFNAPYIKQKLITATTPSTVSGIININHGLTATKILDVNIFVETTVVFSPTSTVQYQVPPRYISVFGLFYDFIVRNNDIEFTLGDNANVDNNSSGIVSKPMRILITYME